MADLERLRVAVQTGDRESAVELTTKMGNVRGVVEATWAAPSRWRWPMPADLPDLRVVVGGAQVTHEFAVKIGADARAPDAASLVEVAKAVVDTARAERRTATSSTPTP
jgi:methanogenic corrinoid protein MtbC1